MKLLPLSAVVTLLCLSSATASWGEPSPGPTPQMPLSNTPPLDQASELTVEEIDIGSLSNQSDERFHSISEEINLRAIGDRTSRDDNSLIPDGMVIRGSMSGGVTVGTEL
jgi:hypothetical protein